MLKLSITMNTGRLLDNLKGMSDAVGKFNGVFDKTARDFRQHMKKVFATEGAIDGAPWEELKDTYAKKKAQKYPHQTILRRKDVLYRSLTKKGARGAVTFKSSTKKALGSMMIGTSIPYATVHQLGDGRRPRRQLIRVSTTAAITLRNFQKHVDTIIRKYGFRRPGSNIEVIVEGVDEFEGDE